VTGDVGAANHHAQAERVKYSNCRIDSAVTTGGVDVELVDCTIVARPASATNGIAAEVVGGYLRITNCVIEAVDGTSSFGMVNVTNIEDLRRDFLLDINGLYIRHRGDGSEIRVVMVSVGTTPTTHKVDLRIRDLQFDQENAQMFSVLSLTGSADISSVLTVEMSDLRCPPGSLMVASQSANYTAPMRLPSQTVKEALSLTTSITGILGDYQTYRHRYPRRPLVLGNAIHRTDGVAFTWTPGGANVPVIQNNDVEANQIRLGVRSSSGGNFSNANDVTVTATVGIADF
jgi:hypothetical protein